MLIPILKDVPFANALNLTVGDRYSKYSNFGSTNNTKFAIEYRPIEDLLLRGTVSKVFRAPTITDLYPGRDVQMRRRRSTRASAWSARTPRASVVPGDGSFQKLPGQTSQINGVLSGSVAAGYHARTRSRASRSTTASSTIRTGFRACR